MVTDRRLHAVPDLEPDPVEEVRYPSPMVLTAEADEVDPALLIGLPPRRRALSTLHLVTDTNG
jgi:hypothetical protein